MSEKRKFVILLVILALSLTLLVYVKMHIGPDFVHQL